jgi:hypothetical protein
MVAARKLEIAMPEIKPTANRTPCFAEPRIVAPYSGVRAFGKFLTKFSFRLLVATLPKEYIRFLIVNAHMPASLFGLKGSVST